MSYRYVPTQAVNVAKSTDDEKCAAENADKTAENDKNTAGNA